MIDFGTIENTIRTNIDFGDIFKLFGDRITKIPFIKNYKYELVDLYKNNIRSLNCKRSYKNRYCISFDMVTPNNHTVKRTLIIDTPVVFNNGYVLLNNCTKIPLIQFVDNKIEPKNNLSIRLYNNLIDTNIRYSEKHKAFFCNLSGSTNFFLLPLLVIISGGFDKFLKKYFKDLDITLSEKTLTPSKNLSDYIKISNDLNTISPETLFKLQIFNFKINKNVKSFNVDDLDSWKSCANINGVDFITLYLYSNVIDLFSTCNNNDIDDAFNYIVKLNCNLTEEQTDLINKKIKLNRNNIEYKRSRIYEVLLIPLFEQLFKIIINRPKARNDSTIRLDLCKKINKEFSSLYQLYDDKFSVISMLYNCNKISFLGYQNIDKNKVSTFKRVIHNSYNKTICPIVTAERENCGVINQLVAGFDLTAHREKRIKGCGNILTDFLNL